MYRVVDLPRKVLITTDEVIKLAPTEGTVSPRLILSAIEIAEDRFIKPSIGATMYNDFRDQKNVVVTSINKSFLEDTINDEIVTEESVTLEIGDIVNSIDLVTNAWYKTLWNEYLWKIAAEAVIYVAIPTNYTRFTAEGQMQNNPRTVAYTGDGAGSASAELKDVKFIMDKTMQDRIDPLISSMHEWICDNKDHYPYYMKLTDCKCTSKSNGVSVDRKTGFVHGIYDRRKRRCDGCE
jgi:hypothetical protein